MSSTSPCQYHAMGNRCQQPGRFLAEPRGVRYADLGGVEDVLADIRELIEEPLQNPEVYLSYLQAAYSSLTSSAYTPAAAH